VCEARRSMRAKLWLYAPSSQMPAIGRLAYRLALEGLTLSDLIVRRCLTTGIYITPVHSVV